jgi:signal transduction histidine kinase
MSVNRRQIQLLLLLPLYLLIITVSLYNRLNLKYIDITLTEKDGLIYIADANKISLNAGLAIGDRIVSVDDVVIVNKPQARWELHRKRATKSAKLTIDRDGISSMISVPISLPLHPLFYPVSTLLGITIFAVGWIVAWAGPRDRILGAFLRTSSLAGISLLMQSHENVFTNIFIHHSYGLLWLGCYVFLAPAIVDFHLRFPVRARFINYTKQWVYLLFLPSSIIFGLLVYQFLQTYQSYSPTDILKYEHLFNHIFSPFLLLCLLGILVRLTVLYFRPLSERDYTRNRWILLCSIVGLAPFMFLYKLPAIFDFTPIIPNWAALSMMLILPLGWGMTVASFRLLRIEWVLSRSIVYTFSTILGSYLVVTTILIALKILRVDVADSPVMIVLIIVLAVITVAGIMGRIKWIVDRLFYNDWFDYPKALAEINQALSITLTIEKLADTLTQQLINTLKIQKATLLIYDKETGWMSPRQEFAINVDSFSLININDLELVKSPLFHLHEDSTDEIIVSLVNSGYTVSIPLLDSQEPVGILLVGRKLSGAAIGAQGRHLLSTLSSLAGTVLKNVLLNRKIIEHEKKSATAELAGGIAHEINNALGPLTGQAQLAKRMTIQHEDDEDMQQTGKWLDTVIEMSQRIQRISQNLGRLSAPPKLEKRPVSLNEIVKETISLMNETVGRIKHFSLDDQNAKYQLGLRLNPDLPTVLADSQEISQVLINLIINASDALEEQGYGTLTLETDFLQRRNEIVVSISDNGPGIKESNLEKIFQPYFTTKPKDKGTGLGLSLIRSIIEAHNGHIRVASKPDEGTRFTIHLPGIE